MSSVCMVIVHYTGMKTAQDSLNRLCDPLSEVSSHYLIDEQGGIFYLVDETKRAWHAGKSFWQGITDINSCSIGIELQNGGHKDNLPPYPLVQLESLSFLLKDICNRWKISPNKVLGHSDIAPTRKQDPGEHFPWPWLMTQLDGFWPSLTLLYPRRLKGRFFFPHSMLLSRLLYQIGYDVAPCSKWTISLLRAIEAVQMRYLSQKRGAPPTASFVALLRQILYQPH